MGCPALTAGWAQHAAGGQAVAVQAVVRWEALASRRPSLLLSPKARLAAPFPYVEGSPRPSLPAHPCLCFAACPAQNRAPAHPALKPPLCDRTRYPSHESCGLRGRLNSCNVITNEPLRDYSPAGTLGVCAASAPRRKQSPWAPAWAAAPWPGAAERSGACRAGGGGGSLRTGSERAQKGLRGDDKKGTLVVMSIYVV